MEITDFLTQNFLSSFTGTLVAVELIVFTTKDFPLIKKIPTRLYTFSWSIIHLVIVKVTSGVMDLNVECVYRLFINALVVTLMLCGGYDTIMQRLNTIIGSGEKIGKGNVEKTEENSIVENKDIKQISDENNVESK
ncbi:hypothetical protein [Clostridium sp. D53t1_180928_C8]|uniref:hypothetical protein n=1 Tax=Clostridium sp. D53t1_180928_C8 TaxID=2787101 RepID=UPI0018AC18DF|nr:hypothetical protein [Clostridium sp. D53t1_180928_C8]